MSASELDYRHSGQSAGSVGCSPSRIPRLSVVRPAVRAASGLSWRHSHSGALGGAGTPHHQANASCGASRRCGVSLTTCLPLTVGTFQQVSPPAPRRGASDQPPRRGAVPSSRRWSRGCVPSSALCGAPHQADIGAAWKKTSREGRDYISVKLDDPSFPAAIYATLSERPANTPSSGPAERPKTPPSTERGVSPC
jgi:Protein of unknown function (DUF736)